MTKLDILRKFQRSTSESETSDPGHRRSGTCNSIILILAIGIFSISPVIWYSHIPLLDYPNHLARLEIHKDMMLHSPSPLSKFFEFCWALIPNLGLDLLTFPLIRHMPVELSGRLALIVSMLMIYGGTVLLDRELNRPNWSLSLFSGIFLYCGPFIEGFVNYFIGIGFAICTFWLWVRYREKAVGMVMVLVFILLGGFVFLVHLEAFGIYAVCVFGYECSLLWERLKVERRLSPSLFRIPIGAAISLIIPALLILFSPMSSDTGRRLWMYLPFWASLAKKIEGLVGPIFYANPVVEIPLLFIVFVLFVWGLATRTIVANRRMMFTLVVFAVIYIVMPYELLGDSVDCRLPSAVAFIALASFGWGKASPARRDLLRLLLVVCLIVRIGSIFSEWQPAQGLTEEYETALRSVPPGSRLLVYAGPIPELPFSLRSLVPAVRRWLGEASDRNPPLRHVPALAAAMHGVFDPDTFTNGTKANGFQLLSLRPDYRDYWMKFPLNPERIHNIMKYDYLMIIRRPSVTIPSGITLEEIKRGRSFRLYRIER
jgi:hypothetical protein